MIYGLKRGRLEKLSGYGSVENLKGDDRELRQKGT